LPQPGQPGEWLPSFLEWMILFIVAAWILMVSGYPTGGSAIHSNSRLIRLPCGLRSVIHNLDRGIAQHILNVEPLDQYHSDNRNRKGQRQPQRP